MLRSTYCHGLTIVPTRQRRGTYLAILMLGLLLVGASAQARAEQLIAAVAANFSGTIKQLKPVFEQKTGHVLVTSFASSGTLYAQIQNGAPFDVFLSADKQYSRQVINDGLAVKSSLLIYAIGQLILWSSDADLIDDQGNTLSDANRARKGIQRIALANPKTAPYGMAALQTLEALSLSESTQHLLVTGQNVAQVFQFLVSGNAEVGFIAESQFLALPSADRGSRWKVPANLYSPIEQTAVKLVRSKNPIAAQAFLDFLKSPEAIAIINASGYLLNDTASATSFN